MIGKVDWDVFAYKFRDNPQKAFEMLAYHVFCRKFNRKEGIPSYYNQKHIETEPIECDGKRIGFQAKYYSSPSINARQKAELMEAVKGAATTYKGISELYFYVNKPFSQSSVGGMCKTESQKEIELMAEELDIHLHWVFPSQLEIILSELDMRDLWTYFFESDKKELYDAIMRPKSLEEIIVGFHGNLLTQITEDDKYDWKTKAAILSGYSQFVKKNENCIEFLKLLDSKYPKEDKIRLVLDNLKVHTSDETRKYLETIPGRFEFVFTPKHGSWLNLIEGFFSKITRQMLKGIRVKTKDELVQRIYQYFEEVNSEPVVYHWKYKLEELDPDEKVQVETLPIKKSS